MKRRIEEMRPSFPDLKCDFHVTRKGIPVDEVRKLLDAVIRDNYFGWIGDEWDNQDGEDLNDIIYFLTQASEDNLCQEIVRQLIEHDSYWPPDGEEPFYSEEHVYREDTRPLGQHKRLWAMFRKQLLHNQRFFNPDAKHLMSEIFEAVHQQRDSRGAGPVYLIEPGKAQARFFRARIAETVELQKEIRDNLARNLGPPPERLRKAGRLNPSGISAFYAAFDLDTCFAELRPSVGSTVASAEFTIKQPICVLDTTRFDAKPKSPDVFAQGARQKIAQWQFMQSFMREIAQPISPGEEHLDYIPTQAVAEYLVHLHEFSFAGRKRTIDAVIYRSAQNPSGKNIAILGSAASVGVSQKEDESKDQQSFIDSFPRVYLRPPEQKPRIEPVSDTFRLHKVRGATFDRSELIGADDDLSLYYPGENDDDSPF